MSSEQDARAFSDEPTGAEGGKSGSLQGAAFRQGRSTKVFAEGAAVGLACFGDGLALGEPQQHEAPWHRTPQWQFRACEAASNEAVSETLDALASPARRQASATATAGQGRSGKGLRGG